MSRLALLAFVLAPLAVACDKESEEADNNGPGAGTMPHCEDRIEVDAQLEIFTDDGQLGERFAVVLVSTEGTNPDTEGDDVFFSLALEDSFEGTMAVEDFVDVDGYDNISVSMSGGFVDQAFLGEVMATGEVQSGSMVTVDRIPMVTLESYPMED